MKAIGLPLLSSFCRRDAFTSKPISQHSLAYEKASIIFNIASVLSSLGARTNRLSSGISSLAPASAATGVTSPFANADAASTSASGTKLAYTSLRQAAGMLNYINDNFLHAPSSDMSKDVIRWLVDVQLAQATEVFWERTLEEKKGGSLVARLAAQVTLMYSALAEEAKEWVGRSIFEKSWALLVQVSFPCRLHRDDLNLILLSATDESKVLCIGSTVLSGARRPSSCFTRLLLSPFDTV
jgi:tyrosine-protein phosphatase non-receptor type 23